MEHKTEHKQGAPTTQRNKKKVLIKGYTTASGRTVPDHYRSSPRSDDTPKGTFIERRLINPKRPLH